MREYLLHMQAAFCSIPRVQICDASIYILLRQHLVSMEMGIFFIHLTIVMESGLKFLLGDVRDHSSGSLNK